MLNYLFEIVEECDLEGEMFFVQEENEDDALITASKYFPYEFELIGVYDDEDAEIMGYDTY